MSEKFYMTTAIAYASRKPHFGNTYEVIMSDAVARYQRACGKDVFFCTGTDEHGQKIENLANEQGRDVIVIPGNPTYEHYKGSNKLLRDGARALLDANDVFFEYINAFPHKINPEKAFRQNAKMSEEKPKEASPNKLVAQVDKKLEQKSKKIIANNLSKNAKIVYNQLDKPIFMLDEINCTLTANEMLAAVTELEILGYIEALPGGRYGLK